MVRPDRRARSAAADRRLGRGLRRLAGLQKWRAVDLQQRGIENVIVMGVHLNMCVLGRPFSIRQMVNQGKNVLLMRDLTDTMYNSRRPPYVNHFVGTDRMIEHVEKYWCPSISSVAFLGGEPFRFRQDRRPRIAFLIGEVEYDAKHTLPAFAQEELAQRFGLDCFFIQTDSKTNITGLEKLRDADAAVFYFHRREFPPGQMALIQSYLASGKPVVGIRTASHGFQNWLGFDPEILGGHYQGHHNNAVNNPAEPRTLVRVLPEAARHPIVNGLTTNEFEVPSWLYKVSPLVATATPLLMGRVGDRQPQEPVAWINTNQNRRVFYTSLGHPADFKLREFRLLLRNGILWAAGQPIPPAENDVPAAPPAKPKSAAASQPGPLSPAESLRQFKVADDLEIEQVLAEPAIAQPVFLNFDERGRMWVVEYRQYPAPAGLKVVSHDQFWRAVYDRIPPPPPNHFRGLDRITIHEDTHGDGIFDKHTTFVEGLNIVTAVVKGRGGVWVLNPPYLLFYPDRNNDDIPDGDPVVHLSGFGLEDTHSVANSLRWGPDGWLYGAQGSTVTGNMIRPGLDREPLHTMPSASSLIRKGGSSPATTAGTRAAFITCKAATCRKVSKSTGRSPIPMRLATSRLCRPRRSNDSPTISSSMTAARCLRPITGSSLASNRCKAASWKANCCRTVRRSRRPISDIR